MFGFLRKTPRADRRREPRSATFRFVDICDENGRPLVEATIRQISDHGACLRLKSAKRPPEKIIVLSQPDRVSCPARLKWMSGVSIGVEFDKA